MFEMPNIYPCCEVNLSRNGNHCQDSQRGESSEGLSGAESDHIKDEVEVKSEPTGLQEAELDNADDLYLGHAVDEPHHDTSDDYYAGDNSNMRQGCQMVFFNELF